MRRWRYCRVNAPTEPGHSVQRSRCRSCTRARLRQPRLPSRRAGHDPAALRRQALDLLPARVPRVAARATPSARTVHRAVLSRRGDRVRRRPPPMRPLPQRGLPEARGNVAQTPSLRTTPAQMRSTHGSMTSGSTRGHRPHAVSGGSGRRSRHCRTGHSSLGTTGHSSCGATGSCVGRPPGTTRRSTGREARRPCSHPRRSWRCFARDGRASCRCCTPPREHGRTSLTSSTPPVSRR